jgi:hypothetical protein
MNASGVGRPESFRDWFRARWRIVEPFREPYRVSAQNRVEKPGSTVEPAKDQPPTAVPDSVDEDVSVEQHQATVIHVNQLKSASKWAAGGFSAAAAIITFFGVKEALLNEARAGPGLAMYLFQLLGIGVISTLFVGAIHPTIRIHLWAIIAAVAVMVGLMALYFPNIELGGDLQQGGLTPLEETLLIIIGFVALVAVGVFLAWRSSTLAPWILFLVGAVAIGILLFAVGAAIVNASSRALPIFTATLWLYAIFWSFVRKITLPAIAGIIILGVAATSLGLYGITKLSIQAIPRSPVEPQITASLEQADGRTVLKIVAVPTRSRPTRLLITVTQEPRMEEVQGRGAIVTSHGEIWRGVLELNSVERKEATVTIPLAPARWESVTVSHCQVDERQRDRCVGRQEPSQILRARNPMEAGVEITGNIIAASTKSLQATLTARNVPWGIRVQAEICRVRRGGHARQLTYATLTPDASSVVIWKVPVPVGTDGEGLVLQYRQCPRGSACTGSMTQLAKYILP